MAEKNAALFFNRNRSYGVDTILFDLLLSENHEYGNEVSNYNIETGVNINDNIYLSPFTGSISGYITNFSLSRAGNISNKAQDVFNALIDLRNKRKLVNN